MQTRLWELWKGYVANWQGHRNQIPRHKRLSLVKHHSQRVPYANTVCNIDRTWRPATGKDSARPCIVDTHGRCRKKTNNMDWTGDKQDRFSGIPRQRRPLSVPRTNTGGVVRSNTTMCHAPFMHYSPHSPVSEPRSQARWHTSAKCYRKGLQKGFVLRANNNPYWVSCSAFPYLFFYMFCSWQ